MRFPFPFSTVSFTTISTMVVTTLLASTLNASLCQAQCTNMGNIAPTPEDYAANLVKLKYAGTGPGFGDDKPELFKSAFSAPSLGFNPNTLHSVHVTITDGTNLMWTASIPPSLTLWTSVTLSNGNVRWTYFDPTMASGGVRLIKMNQYVGGSYVIVVLQARNQSIANAPTSLAHVMVEIENGGIGYCYDGSTNTCVGSGNTQKCYVY